MVFNDKKEWFDDWFDSPYYHILYKHRNDAEAQQFIQNLIAFLDIQPHHKILDLACGKGRHSIYMNKQGLDVVGVDLSASNIEHAQQYENEKLHFARHDMRRVYQNNSFDFVLNMFTSFGYFATEQENLAAIQAATTNLKPQGKLVIDFFNTYKVLSSLPAQNQVEIEGVDFKTYKHLENNFVKKQILFTDGGQDYEYYEKVKALKREEFLFYLEEAGLKLITILGDYQLAPFHKETSERMIFIAEKV